MIFPRRSFLLGLGALPLARLGHAQTASPATRLIAAARKQVGVTKTYDGAYQSLAYPNGDIPRERGVCTDVIIRAYRDAFDFDLQKTVHEDMRANFSAYPGNWGLSRPDRNIDHRRVPNLEKWLARKGAKRALPDAVSALKPGDLVTMRLMPGNLPHIAIISDRVSATGLPLIIHNIGAGTREEPLSTQLQALLLYRFRYLDAQS